MSREDMFLGNTASSRKRVKKATIVEREEYAIEKINIADIVSPDFHDRSYISRAGIDELATNIKEVGQLIEPVVVRRLDNGYERITGYRRIEAAKQLGWESVPARIMDVDKDEAILIMLSENLQRENLNAYDETFSIVQYLSISIGEGVEDTVSLLYKIRNYFSGNIKGDDELERQIQEIGGIIERLGKFQLGGFVNRLKVLNVDPEIIAAMREDNLSYSNALLINQIRSNKHLMKTLISLTLRKELNHSLLKERVREAKMGKTPTKKESIYAKYMTRVKEISKKMNSKKFTALDPKKQERAFELLEELEMLAGGK